MNEVGLDDFWASRRYSPMTYHQLPQTGLVTPVASVVSVADVRRATRQLTHHSIAPALSNCRRPDLSLPLFEDQP